MEKSIPKWKRSFPNRAKVGHNISKSLYLDGKAVLSVMKSIIIIIMKVLYQQ